MAAVLDKEVYLLEELAKLLRVHLGTIYRWRKEGRFVAYKPGDGQRYRVRKEEVSKLLGVSPTNEPQGQTSTAMTSTDSPAV